MCYEYHIFKKLIFTTRLLADAVMWTSDIFFNSQTACNSTQTATAAVSFTVPMLSSSDSDVR